MILFTVGTSVPFDRLVSVADAVADACDERVVVQGGHSACRFERAELLEFLPYDQLEALVREARVVVTHAGAGTALLALGSGKRPVLVPRLRRHGEAIDDHQIAFAERLAALGLARVVADPVDLPKVLLALPADEERPETPTGSLVSALREHLLERLGPPPAGPSGKP